MKLKIVIITVASVVALGVMPMQAATAAPVASTSVASVSAKAHLTAGAKLFANCTALNKTYKHGVGKKGAKDKVSGKSKPVTNFKVDNALYSANKKSDRDGDGVACEKR
ncbi:excalibur calcium-binding domain-containing protein [Glaciihabitans sp. dw_435]|uniref:excalibur calcium-binding domain-containing protein n=1 Tax=Glaciihabitans sp. dw_435 TaxID=2720081 RepID=UPI001BD3C0F4|nr:excalibur calcium-binding domain-containing protein [Glaciihabitans sp. dw_435]